jgi:hypothetical protein
MTAQPVMAARHTTQIVRLMATAITQVVQSVLHLVVVAMTVMRVQHVVTMSVNRAPLVTAKIARHAQVLVVASATATVQSALHTASQTHHDLKTAPQSADGQKIAVAILLAKRETLTALTVQHEMIHANQLSAV